MMKERMMAIFIGGLMLLSVAGFALMGLGRFGTENQPIQTPTIIKEPLTPEEVSGILRTGRVLIRDLYTEDCSDCLFDSATLELFVNSFGGYIILETALVEPDNYTVIDGDGRIKFEMVSASGDIIDLSEVELTQEGLTDKFCEISVVQPRECLLREIGTEEPVNLLPGSQDENETVNESETIDTTNATNSSV